MSYFNIVAQSSESTVVTEYKPQSKRSEAYQSEADLEQEFIRLLCELGYERLTIHKEADLIANLRTQLEKLNNYILAAIRICGTNGKTVSPVAKKRTSRTILSLRSSSSNKSRSISTTF